MGTRTLAGVALRAGFLFACLLWTFPVQGQALGDAAKPSDTTAPDSAAPDQPTAVVEDVHRLKQGLDTGFEVVVNGLRPSVEGERPQDQKQWVLFFDGEPVRNLVPVIIAPAAGTATPQVTVFRFAFRHEASDKPAWRDLFSKAGFFRSSTVSLGPATGQARVQAKLVPFKRMMVPWDRFLFLAIFLGCVIALVWGLGIHSALLRDGDAYSLGRSQMAFWFVVVLAAYLFIGVVMGTWTGTVGGQALALMGISAATGVAAAAITADKRQSAAAAAAAPQGLQQHKDTLEKTIAQNVGTPVVPLLTAQLSDTTMALARASIAPAVAAAVIPPNPIRGFKQFWRDIVSDGDGVALHRFQVITWTFVLGVVFLMRVIVDLTMPELDPTLLTLLGISSGAYLGFKFPEKP